MDLMFVRPAKLGDETKFLDWSVENPDNGFDPEVAKSPSTFVLCAYDKTGAVAYQPVQQVFMMDSYAGRPGNTKLQTAVAMKELFQETVTQAHIKGVSEIYYLGTEVGTDAMTTKHVFEELPYKVFRVKVASLEG
jgi:hypothetical protein